MHLSRINIKRFKNVVDSSLTLGNVNVLVGENGSGKTSHIQAIHFVTSILQSIKLNNLWSNTAGASLSTSLSANQLIYTPTEDVYSLGYGGNLTGVRDNAILITLDLSNGERISIEIFKGKNKNLSVVIQNPQAANDLNEFKNPFSVFSPGLAGVAKSENYASSGLILRAIARGDANLFLRNILLRLSGSEERWAAFLSDLQQIFPNKIINVNFDGDSDEFVNVHIQEGGETVPIELAGTGLLQAIQILSYIHEFGPKLIVLDEPDSHLHPNNQRLLCDLLSLMAETRSVQSVLTTHSRHMIDSVDALAKIFWVRDGTASVAEEHDTIAILLSLGALDIREKLAQKDYKFLILTEDTKTNQIKTLALANGIDLDETEVFQYNGVTKIANLRPLIAMIRANNPQAKIMVHRDRDLMTDNDVAAWEAKIRVAGCVPFVTSGLDIECYFLNRNHLTQVNQNLDAAQLEFLFTETFNGARNDLIMNYVNKKAENERAQGRGAQFNPGQAAVEAAIHVDNEFDRFCAGKVFLKRLRGIYQQHHGVNLIDIAESDNLEVVQLADVANEIFNPL